MSFGLRHLWVQTPAVSLIGWERELLRRKIYQGREGVEDLREVALFGPGCSD